MNYDEYDGPPAWWERARDRAILRPRSDGEAPYEEEDEDEDEDDSKDEDESEGEE